MKTPLLSLLEIHMLFHFIAYHTSFILQPHPPPSFLPSFFLPSLIHSPPMSLLSFLLPPLLSPLSPLSSLPSGEQHGQSSHPLILLWIRDGVEDDARLVLLHQLKGKLQVCKVGIIQSYKLASLSVCG